MFLIIVFQIIFYIWVLNHSRNQLKRQVECLQKQLLHPISKNTKIEDKLLSTEIYNKFKEKSKQEGNRIKDEDWQILEDTIVEYFEDFNEKVGKMTELNDNEYKISLLLKCKFKPIEISHLICQSKENVTSIRRRLCKKYIDAQSVSPKKWDQFINSI